MALFRKGVLSAIADSISATTQISVAREKQDLLLTTAETLQAIGELSDNDKLAKGVEVSASLVEVIKQVNKML